MSQISQKCQDAFAEYIQSQKSSVTEISDCFVTSALTDENYDSLPAIVVRSDKSEEIAMGQNVHEVELIIAIASHPDDDADDVALHKDRTRAIYELLFDISKTDASTRDQIVSSLNKPSSGPDNRSVKDFTCSGYIMTTEDEGRTDRHVESSFTLLVTCSWGDPS